MVSAMTKLNYLKNHVRIILGSQYFLYFGVLGIFLPYFNLYCYHLGFSGFQIGALSAFRTGTTVLFPLLWGAIADRFLLRKSIYILCNFISTAIWALLLYTVDFWMMLGISIFYGIFYAPIISFLESFTMDALGKKKKEYGKIRVWGSINFIIIVILLGRIIDIYSVNIIIVLILAGSLIQSLISVSIPDIKTVKSKSPSQGMGVLLSRRFLIFLFCAFLMLLSHGTYYGFFSIHLDNLGFGKTFIGICWGLASASEILVMIQSDRIFKRFSLENVLIFSFFIAAIRWCILFFAVSPLLILGSQILHALTYGAFHVASILYVDNLTPGETKTMGQAVNNAVTYGLGMVAGFILNGYFFETVGAPVLFIMSSLAAVAGGMILWGFRRTV